MSQVTPTNMRKRLLNKGDGVSDSASAVGSQNGEPFDEEYAQDSTTSFTLPIIEEGPPLSNKEKEWMSLAGRIEILLLEDQDENGELCNRRLQIICLPSDAVQVQYPLYGGNGIQDDSILEDEGEETPISSVFEHIASSFMESCAASPCEPVLPKSVLRKRGEDKNVQRSVKFDKIDIHEFNMTLGHHPSAVTGPPMAIDWEKEARVSSVSLDEYEKSRGTRRHRKQLKMSMKTRCGILQKEGNFTANEITQAWEEALLVRKQRRETLKGGVYEMVVTDFWESFDRKFKRVTNNLSSLIL